MLNGRPRPMGSDVISNVATPPTAASDDDLTRLACLWSQQELCGRRPVKMDPFAWACHEPNVDSFLLFVRPKRLPNVPTSVQAVMQQRQAMDEEADNARDGRGVGCIRDAKQDTHQGGPSTTSSGLDDPLGPPPPERPVVTDVALTMSYNLFDDDEGGDWQLEPDDWW